VIIGGGYIGCEMAEAMGGLWGISTTLIEKEEHVLNTVLDPEMNRLVARELTGQGIDLRTNCTVEKVVRNGDGGAVHLAAGEVLEADFIVICVGVVPETTLARDCGLTIGITGAIFVDDHFRTSDPDIYAGGDCVEVIHRFSGERVYYPLGSLANRHGWMIAENLAGNSTSYPGVIGNFLVKIFDLNIGSAGFNSAAAARFVTKPATVWATCPDRPDYYPESKTITLKMIYGEDDGRLWGLQVVGEGDVARRIDVFSSFLQSGGGVDDLLFFEHGYAPPFNEGIDPLHHLAGIARARQRGTTFMNPLDVDQSVADGAIVLDVREAGEQQDKPLNIPRAVGLPLDRLRSELAGVPSDKKIILLCQRGGRAYQAAIYLQDAGFTNVAVLGGGKAMLG
jgi:NADPH-dependent 2,4-dienoyl-CoA reductase/sulfur reductase-like enzyme/rhodanese-related sulfurtransferase